jgi:hypothetical protein
VVEFAASDGKCFETESGWSLPLQSTSSRKQVWMFCIVGTLRYFAVHFLGILFYDFFSVTGLYSVDARVTREWWWWIHEHKHPYLKLHSNPRSQLSSDHGLHLRPRCRWDRLSFILYTMKLGEEHILDVTASLFCVLAPCKFVGRCQGFGKKITWQYVSCKFSMYLRI